VHVDAWMLPAEPPDRRTDVDAVGHTRRHAGDADRPLAQAAHFGDGVPGILKRSKGGASGFEQAAAGVGELRALSSADEEVRAELPLQRQQRRRQAGLHHEQLPGSSGEGALADDGQEVLELSQFHRPSIGEKTAPGANRMRARIR
jgi:hypothetical protein